MATEEWAKVGKYFNGDGEYLDMEPDTRLALAGAGTIEGWFVWLSGKAALLRDSAPGGGWSLGHEFGGHLAYRVAGMDQVTEVPVQSLRDGWHHYVLVKDGSEVTYYLDGNAVHSWTGAPDTPAVMPWRVMRDGPFEGYIEGFAADLALYEIPFTQDRVVAHWESGKARF